MPITVSYQPSAQSVADVAFAGGLGHYNERQNDKALQVQQHQQDLAFQAAQQQANQQADLQRMMIGAQVNEAGNQADFTRGRMAAEHNANLQQQGYQQQADATFSRQKQLADYNAGLDRQALEQKMTLADRHEANEIDNDIRAIQSDDSIHPEVKQTLLTAAKVRDATLRQRVSQQASQIKPRFADLPAERQPTSPPWPATNAQGQTMMRDVYDDEGNVTGQEPVMMKTDKDGVPQPWEDPIAKERRTNAAKAKGNQVRAEESQSKNFATFAGTALKALLDDEGKLPEGAEDRIMTMWEKMQARRSGRPQSDDRATGPQPRATQAPAAVPPAAAKLLQQSGQKAPVKISDPLETRTMKPGTVVEFNGKFFAVPPPRGTKPMNSGNEPLNMQTLEMRRPGGGRPLRPGVDDTGSPTPMPFYPSEDPGFEPM